MKKITSLILVVGLVVAVFAACSKKTEDRTNEIVGTWKTESDFDEVVLAGEYVFNSDGTGSVNSEKIKWSVYDENLYIEKDGISPHYYEFSIKNGVLTLEKTDGSKAEFSKVE